MKNIDVYIEDITWLKYCQCRFQLETINQYKTTECVGIVRFLLMLTCTSAMELYTSTLVTYIKFGFTSTNSTCITCTHAFNTCLLECLR